MHSRPLSSLGRILLVAGAVGFAICGSSSESSSTAPNTASTPTAPAESPASRIDIFAGYSYLAPHGTLTIPVGANIGMPGPISYSSINYGAIGSFNYFFNRYVGGQVEYANHPDGKMTEPLPGSLAWFSAIRPRR